MTWLENPKNLACVSVGTIFLWKGRLWRKGRRGMVYRARPVVRGLIYRAYVRREKKRRRRSDSIWRQGAKATA